MVRPTTKASASSVPAWATVLHKGQPVDTLSKRLKALRIELTKADQDEIPTKTLDHIRSQLSHDDVLFHKKKDIRTALACCQAELLRLYAPDCPYDDDELCTLFNFFLAVLTSSSGGLGKPSETTFGDCVALLSNLVSLRAFALLCDRGISDRVTIDYCTKFFDLVKPDTPKNVEILLSEALTIFIQYSNSVPQDVVEILVTNFQPKVKRMNPPVAHLTQLVAVAAADELQVSVAQYFSDGILRASKVVDVDERESQLHAVHVLITQIHKSTPTLLLNIIPQLEEELRAEDVHLRNIAVRTLGYIFADRTHAIGDRIFMTKKYHSTWKAWLGRTRDKYSAVRKTWADCSKAILLHEQDGEVSAELTAGIEELLIDPDDKVRAAMVESLASLDYATVRTNVARTTLKALGERIQDKKPSVRMAALQAIARFFDLAYRDMASGDFVALEQFSWFPSTMILGTLTEVGKGMQPALQASFEQHVLPLSTAAQVEERISRLLFVLEHLDDAAMDCFFDICNLRGPRGHLYSFVDVCKRFNGGIVESSQSDAIRKTLLRHVKVMAGSASDPVQAGRDLYSFAERNDVRSYKLLAAIMNPESDLETIIKTRTELDKRLGAENDGTTMLSFVRRAGFSLINTSSIPGLFAALPSSDVERQEAEHDPAEKLVQRPSRSFSMRIFALLKLVSTDRTEMLKRHADIFKAEMKNGGRSSGRRSASLMALAKLESQSADADSTRVDGDDIKTLASIAQNGAPKEAKWATRLLSLLASNMECSWYAAAYHEVEQLCLSFASTLSFGESGKIVSALASLSEIATHARDALNDVGDQLTFSLTSNVLMQPYEPTQGASADQEWYGDDDMDAGLKARLAVLQFMTDRCIAFADSDDCERLLKPLLNILLVCMTEGEAQPGLCNSTAAKAHTRLHAALQVLKLCRNPTLDRKIGPLDFQRFSGVLQDEFYEVRRQVLLKMMKHILRRSSKVPARFLSLLFLVAFDPEEEIRQIVAQSCATLLPVLKPDMRMRYFEVGLARLIHLLNHHPDFENAASREGGFSLDSLSEAARYLEFYLECCSTKDNIACLYHIASRCKGMRDALDETEKRSVEEDGISTQGLHTLSELSMCLIRRVADNYGASTGSWQGQIGLPRDLYAPYLNREEMMKVHRRSYLSNEALEHFQQPVRREKKVTVMKKRKQLDADIEKSLKRSKSNVQKKKSRSSVKKTVKVRGRLDDESDEGTTADGSDTASDDTSSDRDGPISDDESVDPSEGENDAGRGARTRRRIRQEVLLRNGDRQRRRAERAQRDA